MLDGIKTWSSEFILGGMSHASQKDQKRALLLGQLLLLQLMISLVYIVYDLVNKIKDFQFVFIALAVASIFIFILNRNEKFTLSAILLILTVNMTIYLFAASRLNNKSAQLFYILSAVGGLALFNDKKRLGYFAILLPIVLFLICNLIDFSVLPKTTMDEIFLRDSYYINVITSFAGVMLIVTFLIRNNQRAEAQLLKNEEELLKSRKRYELAIKGSRAGIWEWDIESGAVYNSPVWKTMLGYHESELENMTLDKFLSMVHPEDREKAGMAVQSHLRHEGPYLAEFRMIRKDQSIFWVSDSGQAVWNEQGNPQQMVGSIVDISERKEAAEKIVEQNTMLAKANTELDRFVYSASHDLRSPLSSLLGLINLAEKATEMKDAHEYLGMMKGRIKVLDEFIKEIVSYSQNARLALELKMLNLHALVTESVDSLKFAAEAQGLDIQINCPIDFKVYADARRLQVVLNNLLGNAIKYKDPFKESQWVQLEAKEISTGWEIVVRDNGIGIKEEHLQKIFNMFYRASEKSSGSGLGLYIVRETLNKMGGDITVQSELGIGSTFKISLAAHNHIVLT
jgi:PAS domain S-box-containing protein